MTTHVSLRSVAAPLGGRVWNKFTRSLAVLVLLFAIVAVVRLVRGIGAVTNLNDGYPWGLWIVYDDVIGTAIGAGGFTVAFATYILNRGAYHPLVRPALVTAFFGNTLAGVSVFLDIGRYWNAWHLVLPKYAQLNSVLFEVAVCICAYIGIVFLELLPVFFEKLRLDKARRLFDKILFLFVAVGVVVPTMQQSALGSLLVVMGPQINPIYQTSLLPVLFLLSTIGMGLAAVVVESTLSSVAFRRELEGGLLTPLMKVGQALIAIFLVVRFADLVVRGALPGLLDPRPVAIVFWIETVLFAASVILLMGKGGTRPQRYFVAAMSMAIGGIMYRFDAYLVAYDTGAGWHYFPSLGEIAVSVGLVAAEILGFIIAIRLLPVLPKKDDSAAAVAG